MDERPPVWIGHAALGVRDVDAAAEFWIKLGLREVHHDKTVAIMELRGGTHLVLFPNDGDADGDAPFDLMVEDLEATHARWNELGLDVSPIERGSIHAAFVLQDPDGHRVVVNDSHVVGEV
jgi:catechol 2,3-dioxygenase-like lactoylglutathione lyase family enzyme